MDFFLCQDIGQELPQGTEEMFPLHCGAFRDRHGMDCTGDHKPPAASTSSALSSGCTLLSQARCGFFVAFPPVFSLKIWHKSLLSPSYHILCLLHLLFPSPVLFFQCFHFCCPSCFAACEEVAYFGAFWALLPPWACFGLCLTHRLALAALQQQQSIFAAQCSVPDLWPACAKDWAQDLMAHFRAGGSCRTICQTCLAELHMLFVCSFTLPDHGLILYAVFYLVEKLLFPS